MNSFRVLLFVLFALAAAGSDAVFAESPESIARTAVKSSSLKSVGYHAPSKTLELEFTNGGIYRYFAVPPEMHKELMKSDSKGKFFQSNIREKFHFERHDKPQ